MVGEAFQIKHFMLVEDVKWIVYLASILALVAIVYRLRWYYRRWTYGGQKLGFSNMVERAKRFLVYGILQRKVLMQAMPGTIHAMIYIGTALLLLATILRFIEADIALPLFGIRFLTGRAYAVFKLMANVGGILLLAGVAAAGYRRAAKLTRDLPHSLEDAGILILLATIAVTGFLLDGMATRLYRYPDIGFWDPVGYLVASALSGVSEAAVAQAYRILWLIHMALAIGSIGALLYTKLGHIVLSGFFNTFFSRLEPTAAFKPIPDVEKRADAGEPIGVVALKDTSWKQRMDYDACTKCARCHNACPANLTGKPLSPMNLVLDMRKAMDEEAWNENLIPARIDPLVVWSCVTCGACVYECPVLIHHVETILDLRRGLISQGENVPEELLQVSYNIMRTGNPYGGNPYDKEEWLSRLSSEGLIEEAQEDKEYDYVLWVGCSYAYDPRLRRVVESLLRVLKQAGLSVAYMPEQGCCGEPARRIGDELMFKEVVDQNRELLLRYKFRKLLVPCPHGYSVFRNEYPLFGVRVDVEHHSQLLARLIDEGRIKPAEKLPVKVTFHDPCYLGRWNGVLEEPRKVLRISTQELREMQRSGPRSFCCGGGGGGVFYDIKIGKRVSRVRAEEAKSTGASVLAVACPFCNVMLSAEAPDMGFEVKDIAEVLDEALAGGQRSA
ncbi:MAG: (Fe-S)-binding protein [Thermoproteota archaeon]